MSTREIPADDERALLSLCTDGARAAAEALARFLDAAASPVEGPERVSVAELERRFPPGATAIGFRLSGGFEGALLHVLTPKDADALLGRIPTAPGASSALDDRSRGILSEVGNIAASAFLNAVATRVRRACLPSVPRFSDGGVRAALERVGVAADHEHVLLVCADVSVAGAPAVSVTLVVAPDDVSVVGLAAAAPA